MNKFAITALAAILISGSGAALANQQSSGLDNEAADAGERVDGAKKDVAPNGVNNRGINNSGTSNKLSGPPREHMSASQLDKHYKNKDGRNPNINEKVQTWQGDKVDRHTDGTTY